MINSYLIKTLILALYSVLIIFLYYFIFPGHSEFNFSEVSIFGQNFMMDKNFLILMFFLSGIYFLYKLFFDFPLKKQKKNEISFSFAKIFGLFLIFLFFICEFYFDFSFFKNIFSLQINGIPDSILLFGKIIYFSLFPIFLFLVTTSFGERLSKFLPQIENFSPKTRFLLSLNLGFFSFLFILTIFSFFGIYSLKIVFFILGFFLAFGIFEFKNFFKKFFEKSVVLDKQEGKGIKILFFEIFSIISFFLLATGLISIIRPYPIGWDDLGVYMNFPNLLANSSGLANFSEMYSWQIFTGIGYLFGEPAFAFFLNFSGYFLSFLTLNLIFSEFFEKKSKTFLPLPIILSTLFLGLPMSIFHSIKDMKLDQGLFFTTTFTVFFLYKYFENLKKDKNFSKIYLFIIGILTGFAFSIKFTSLFLIISILGVISYFFVGIFGLLGFFALFFSFFTAGNLWKMMNVSINFDLKIFLFSTFLGILFFAFGFFRKKDIFKKYFLNVLVFLLGIFIALLPWFSKNFIQIFPKISISGLLNGNPEKPTLDLTKIYNDEKITEIRQKREERIKKEVVTTNEDLKRYLGYESGILPFTNIFWNLTMQTNQAGKFTEISFVFLALLPLIFIFLPFFRNKYFYLVFIIFSFLSLIFFLKPAFVEVSKNDVKNISKTSFEKIFLENNEKIILPYKDIFVLEQKLEKEKILEKKEILEIWNKNNYFFGKISDFFAKINLPFGYFVLFLIFLFSFLIINYFLKKENKTFIFDLNLTFLTIYIFLWMISSFGIVWYGITMYFCLLLIIGFGGFYISKYNEKNLEKKYYSSIVFVSIFLIFMFFTSLPHTLENLKAKAYLDYKTWKKEAIFDTFDLHNFYDEIFFEINISDDKKQDFLKNNLPKNFDFNGKKIENIISELKIKMKNNDLEAKKSLEKIYFGILNPGKKYQNEEKIFRVGTFLKYYISQNQKRVFEDGLLYNFNDYILDENPEKTWGNLKNLGFKYLLVDLGTATIDDSKEHFLTFRYEKFLKNLRAKNLEIIKTDSICLRFATDLYSLKNDENLFFEISSGTYESYGENGEIISRKTKLNNCALQIEKFVNSSEFEGKKFPYLKKYIGKNTTEIFENLPKSKFVIYKIKN